MCGIVCVVGSSEAAGPLRERVLAAARRLRHRGPDWSGICVQELADGRGRRNVLAHERLGIVSPESGAQPLHSEDGALALAVNGEIYNHAALRAGLVDAHRFATGSDCEVIVHLYEELGPELVSRLDGVFAFVLTDQQSGRALAARDPLGVVPLYWGFGADGSVWFASELKAIAAECPRFEAFPPGHYYADGKLVRYYEPGWRELSASTEPADADKLREGLTEAVRKRLMGDVPYGVLLSGGLDSSVVAAVASRLAARRVDDGGASGAWWPRLHSFCIGLPGSPDLAAAAKVAEHLGTAHHELTFTVQEGLDALSDVIFHVESYDITTIRASTPMYLMARKIKALGVKMVLSGEGADEALAGYLYFHKAPDAAELHAETVRKLERLHLYDCLRANKSMAAWGVEARVPFLDQAFLELVMGFEPSSKLCAPGSGRMEKQLLREAFDTADEPYLPQEVLWRQKEQFSDGVGYGWIDALREHAEAEVSDEQWALAAHRFPINTPLSKEGYLYRTLFERHFPQESAARTVAAENSIACSSETALRWEASWADSADPSGRAIASHDAAYPDDEVS
jgi:asparagine synthase (glutamine-hydrolysing)